MYVRRALRIGRQLEGGHNTLLLSRRKLAGPDVVARRRGYRGGGSERWERGRAGNEDDSEEGAKCLGVHHVRGVGRLADGLMPSSESDQPLCARSTHMAFRPHDRAPVMSKGLLCADEQCLEYYDFIL